jgi:hypothetical protein
MTHTSSDIVTVALNLLRPTAITVGFGDVESKRSELKNQIEDISNSSQANLFSAVKGPKNHLYAVSCHSLLRALTEEGIEKVKVIIIKDLSSLNIDSFWLVMDHKQWVQPFNSSGCRVSFREIPNSISKLTDDPFRSLVVELKKAGAVNYLRAKDA